MAIRPGLLQTLALKPGQGFEAVVVGQTPTGATDVLVGKQHLTLTLQPSPPTGTTLQMRIDVTSVGPRFVILSQTPPDLATKSAITATSVVIPAPTGKSGTVPLQAAPTSQQTAATIIERVTPDRAAMALASTFKSGQIVEARIGTTSGSTTQLTIGQQTISLTLPGSPMSGAVVQLRVQATPLGQRFVIVPQSQTSTTGATTAQPMSVAPASGPLQPIVATALPPQTELAAVTQMLQAAAGRQDVSIGLMSTLASLIRDKSQLPPEVANAITRVLGARTDISAGKISGDVLQKAVQNSGIFQESSLARGVTTTQADVKSSLLGLRAALSAWLGGGVAAVPRVQRQPPMRGGIPRAPDAANEPSPVGGTPQLGRSALDRTDHALSRLRLHQNASLPDPIHRTDREWNLELPVIIANQQNVLQMQISRDGGGDAAEGDGHWQMRFAINLNEAGEVGAQVGLRGRRTSVMLWASEAETAQTLREMLPQLREELEGASLDVSAIAVRVGAPSAPTRPSGGLLDATL
ncbi:flagellar hook-length control protein FliK [Devosia rhodophyticola]|uniref:Flagellar hook-length control protein FliK n=1 Tax=Devosia rhodophyticola TaxID=3026423 RepID=A0ABY7YXL8_9HYPH|nr:flagellar hook-length control protein FliK [Devosia rhodophyticola]WDR05833.1 flagellar hook-length control protein FliK [Devosia rhodophyticola]